MCIAFKTFFVPISLLRNEFGFLTTSVLCKQPPPPTGAVFYPAAPGALNVGKFPNPAAVARLLGNNLEAQKFLSRKAQVIIRMRGLPYDASAKQVVSSYIFPYVL